MFLHHQGLSFTWTCPTFDLEMHAECVQIIFWGMLNVRNKFFRTDSAIVIFLANSQHAGNIFYDQSDII
jgi:hypothetical protein